MQVLFGTCFVLTVPNGICKVIHMKTAKAAKHRRLQRIEAMQVLETKTGEFGQKIRLEFDGRLYRIKVSAHKWSHPKVCGGQEFSEPRRVAYSAFSQEAAREVFASMN